MLSLWSFPKYVHTSKLADDERNRNTGGSSGKAKVKLLSLVSTIIKAVDEVLSVTFELFRRSKDSDSSW